MSSTIFDGVIANFVIQNKHYEKLNFEYIDHKVLHSILCKSKDFPWFPLMNIYKILHANGGHVRICMGFSKIKAQGQSQDYVTTTFKRYFLKKRHFKT